MFIEEKSIFINPYFRRALQSSDGVNPVVDEINRVLALEGSGQVGSLSKLRKLIADLSNYGDLASG